MDQPSVSERAQMTRSQANEIVTTALAKLESQLLALYPTNSKTRYIEIENVVTMLEQTRQSIDSQLPLVHLALDLSESITCDLPVLAFEEIQVSRCRLNHVVQYAFTELYDRLVKPTSTYQTRFKKQKLISTQINKVVTELKQTQISIVSQLNWTPIDSLPDLPLLSMFKHLSLPETIHYREVCHQFKILLEEKCRQRKSLKLFAFRPDQDGKTTKYEYCTKVFVRQLPQPKNSSLGFYARGRDDDLLMHQDAFNNDPTKFQRISQLFPAVDTIVFSGFSFDTNFLPAFTNLSTLVLGNSIFSELGPQTWWTSLTSITSLRHLYILYCYHFDDGTPDRDAVRTVLGRLNTFTSNHMDLRVLPMFSSENLTQLQYNDYISHGLTTDDAKVTTWINCWRALCSRQSKLTYLHVPKFFLTPELTISPIKVFRPLLNLKHLVELSFACYTGPLPTVAEIQQYSLQLRSVKKIVFEVLKNKEPESIIALFPALELIVYTNLTSLKCKSHSFEVFRVQFDGTGIKVKHSMEKIEHMTGPYWEEYKRHVDWP